MSYRYFSDLVDKIIQQLVILTEKNTIINCLCTYELCECCGCKCECGSILYLSANFQRKSIADVGETEEQMMVVELAYGTRSNYLVVRT